MQCEVEVLDNIDPAMYCLEVSGSGYHSISKEILKCLENISLFQA